MVIDSLEFIDSIMNEAHNRCGKNTHEAKKHRATSTAYAKYFWGKGFTAKDILDGIIAVAGDPQRGTWTSHPDPTLVERYLNDR